METKYLNLVSGFALIFVATFFIAAPVFAQGNTVRDSGSSSGITNPLGGGQDQTITSVLSGIIKWMLGLVGFLALIALIVGGGRMMIDYGNEEQVRKAKMTIMWAVIGLLVVMLSYAIVNIITTEILGAGGSS
ncbi:MAG: MMCAP2_0565 family pilin-like conjugal transfer protein, partial [Candidatus Andersenbacteria bacterium]